MKKLVKLSLAAAVATAGLTTTASASTLAEAFASAKVSGELKSQYFQKESNATTDEKSSIFVNGGNLSLVTGSYNGLSAGITFQASSVTSIDDEAGKYNNDMNTSGVVMSQAYLAYKLNNTSIKAGRQYISTPLVAGSGSRIFKQSFEGITVVNTDIANTVLVAGYVDKYQHRTSTAGDATVIGDEPTFEQVANGAYTVYAKNNSVENLTAQAQYAVISDNSTTTGEDTTHYYLDGTYKMDNLSISAQLLGSDNGNASDSNGQLMGVKVTNKMDSLTLRASYTTTDDEANVISGLGLGADKSFTASPIAGGNSSYTADTDSYQIGAGYNVNAALALDASYTNWDTNGSGDTSETAFVASYKFNKQLSTKIMYSTFDNVSTQDYRSRVYVSYKF